MMKNSPVSSLSSVSKTLTNGLQGCNLEEVEKQQKMEDNETFCGLNSNEDSITEQMHLEMKLGRNTKEQQEQSVAKITPQKETNQDIALTTTNKNPGEKNFFGNKE